MKLRNYFLLALMLVLMLTMNVLAENGNEWIVNKETDPLTDETSILIFGMDNDYFDGGSQWDAHTLGIRKNGDMLDLIVYPSEYIGRDNNDIKFRFNQGEIVEQNWVMSADNSAFFHPNTPSNTIADFVEKLIIHDRLVFNYQPYNKARQNIVYCTKEFGQAIKPYLEYFGWEYMKPLIEEGK